MPANTERIGLPDGELRYDTKADTWTHVDQQGSRQVGPAVAMRLLAAAIALTPMVALAASSSSSYSGPTSF